MANPSQVSRHAQRTSAVGYPSLSPDDSGIYEQVTQPGRCARCGGKAQKGKTLCRLCGAPEVKRKRKFYPGYRDGSVVSAGLPSLGKRR